MSGELHHLYGPSSLSRRELCPGSARMEKDLPSFETEHAAEGTRLHAEIADILTKLAAGERYESPADGPVRDMFKMFVGIVIAYAPGMGTVSELVGRAKRMGLVFYVEQPLAFTYCGIEQYRGTADVVIVTHDRVIVIDWKTGRREVEPADRNPQTAAYALAAMQMYHRSKATVYIYNPVIGQDTRADFDNRTALAKYMMWIIAECESPDAKLNPGEEQCRYCKAAHFGTCPALAKTAELTAVKASEVVPLPALSVLPAETVCDLKAKCDLIGKLAERVDAEIRRRLENGETCGDWKIKETSGGREITDIQEAFRLSGLPDDVFLTACTCSAAKLEKAYIQSRGADFSTQKAAKADLAEKLGTVIQDKPRKKMLVKG